jgi:DNA segregation ATPase FtsK/SpoIIIE-like protein
VCDEYYALLSGDHKRRREIETQISLLGAKARAAGIHLILATQQPSREVIKGALDSNIPGRIGLMMVKGEESRMLLGKNGAENLLGKGDLFFRDVGEPVRLQAALV